MQYDTIIIGAGAAGCVLAARLSEDPARSVLLLEAGPDYPSAAALPPEIASSRRPAYTHDWDYHGEPARTGRSIHLPRGKLVGGCSATNATAAVRGATPGDYDEWAAAGNPDWTFADVLPCFRRLECDADYRDEWHGADGPLPIRRASPESLTSFQRAFLAACQAAGHPAVADHNAPGVLGVGPWPTNSVAGRRQSAALAYLPPARTRPNLTIRGDTLVNRLLFDGRRAVGVELASPKGTIHAAQIVLAAGAYGSPAILLRSGLGPADELRALGIAVQADLPAVGRYLVDHPLVGVDFAAVEQTEGVPWIQVLLTCRSSPAIQGYDLHIFAAGPNSNSTSTTFTLFTSLMKPRSRGVLQLRSSDPCAPPRIYPGYFADPADLPRMIAVVRLARCLARTRPLSHLVLRELTPGPLVGDRDDELAAAILAGVESYHHPVGTCRMGPDATQAVVDQRGRVHGVTGLSVIDASIMPTIPAANTHLPTLMIAERCAAWLAECR